MARRKQLRGIAGNLTQWLLSRNFDNKGYWAIGQLYACAEQNKTNKLVLNLKEKSLSPNPWDVFFSSAFKLADGVFIGDLKAHKIPGRWVKKIMVTFSFNESYKREYHFGSALGQPFVCAVEITTDLDKTYVCERRCNCWVHDPKKESRRYGF